MGGAGIPGRLAICLIGIIFVSNTIILRLPLPIEKEGSLISSFLANFTKGPISSTNVIAAAVNERDLAFEDQFPKEPRPRPKLDEIVQGWNITGDPSWLLNVAVIGFPKCGTSSLMHHLDSHKEVKIFTDERCDLGGYQEVTLIRDLYNKFEPGDFVRGYKCPGDIDSSGIALPAIKKHFPKAHLIVGIRHPVLWYESFYNFRVHNGFNMTHPNKGIGRCTGGLFHVCTDRSQFHYFLGNLGKTNISDPDENALMPVRFRSKDKRHVVNLPNKVFLYEVSQLSDKNEKREAQFLEDFQHFLHLREPIKSFIWFKPGKKLDADQHKERTKRKIDICKEEYKELRSVLLDNAKSASEWIRRFFLKSEDVVVSSPEYFEELMDSWLVDPCIKRRKANLS